MLTRVALKSTQFPVARSALHVAMLSYLVSMVRRYIIKEH